MGTLLPRDDNHHPIPALRLNPGGAHTLSLSATPVRTAAAFSPQTRVISLYATGAAFIRSGDAAVTAGSGDHYLPANLYLCLSVGDDALLRNRHTHLAAISADGSPQTLYLSELE